jgi:outer membrane protein OmpA-like peptidoglycan-associated protein
MSRMSAAPLLLALGALAGAPAQAASYKPRSHLVELGLFLGGFVPSRDHQLYDEHYRQQPFQRAAFDFGLRAAYLPLSFLGAELEGAVMPTLTANDDSALLYHVRAHALVQYPARLAPFALFGAGWLGVSSSSAALGRDADFYPHWGAGLKLHVSERLGLRLDGRHIIGADKSKAGRVAHLEFLLGVSYLIGRSLEPPKPRDTDLDAIPDAEDRCPGEAGEPPTGCPRPKDEDGDGIADDKDRCPSEAGEPPDGCPKPKDEDADGITDDKDKCPKEPGKAPDGCPIRDSDGDGILDDKDKCPKEAETKNGFEDEDGCPDQLPEAVKKFAGAIKGITFEPGKATIRKRSFAVLDEAVRVLNEHQSLRLKVRGHTDDRGKAEKNKALSGARARAVAEYLTRQGVAADRLTHEGLGAEEPTVSNKTAKGRAANRRIEFKIVVD